MVLTNGIHKFRLNLAQRSFHGGGLQVVKKEPRNHESHDRTDKVDASEQAE